MKSLHLILLFILLSATTFEISAQTCQPSGYVYGTKPPPGQCNTENDSQCCVQGQPYKKYFCSGAVTSATRANLTLNSFQSGGDGGGASACPPYRFYSDNQPVVALSTGWFKGGARCHEMITINGNGRSTKAMVVDECDSTVGCDAEHDYQPPCRHKIVDASKAVWNALGVSEDNDNYGMMEITWSE